MATKRAAKKAETVTTKAVKETAVNAETKMKKEPVNAAASKEAKEPVKEVSTAKEPVVQKEVTMNTDVYVQYWGKEVYSKDIVENIRTIWTDEMGKCADEMEDLKLYIKPEDNGVHYVINGNVTGFLGL
jgi:hypothetical protein